MATPAKKEAEKSERELESKVFRKWGGVYTRSARTGMPPDKWFDLQNLQPIGDANVHTINNISAALIAYGADPIYGGGYANLLGVDYLYLFSTTGKVFQYNIAAKTSSQINSGNLLSGAGACLDQWENLAVLFGDSTGYYKWDGTTFAKITVTGAPSSVSALAVYQGRVFLASGRLVTYSVAAGTNGANTGYGNNASDFLVASGAGTTILVDPQIRVGVTRMISANGYLYLLAASAINVIADLYVPTGASPPTPVFTNLNIQPIIGTDQPFSVYPFGRSLMFANAYGTYSLDGTQATKVSTDIDGTWQYRDPAQAVSGGQVVVNNILTAAFLIKRLNDPIFGSNYVIALWWDDRWWFANYGVLTFCCYGLLGNVPALFVINSSNQLCQAFGDPTTYPNTSWMGPLWDMEDPIRNKQMIRAGVEVEVFNQMGTAQLVLNADGPQSSTALPATGVTTNLNWVNNSGQTVTWVNNSSQVVVWFSGSYLLYSGSAPAVGAKYLGLSGSTVGMGFQLSALMFDYLWSSRWTP